MSSNFKSKLLLFGSWACLPQLILATSASAMSNSDAPVFSDFLEQAAAAKPAPNSAQPNQQTDAVANSGALQLAQYYNVSPPELLAMHPGPSLENQQLNQKLGIPTTTSLNEEAVVLNQHQHSVQLGETIWAISRKYNVSPDAILQANPGIEPTTLQVNQKLVIPGSPSSVVTVQVDAQIGASLIGKSEEQALTTAQEVADPLVNINGMQIVGNYLWGGVSLSSALAVAALAVWYGRQKRQSNQPLLANAGVFQVQVHEDSIGQSSSLGGGGPLQSAHQVSIPLRGRFTPDISLNKATWYRYLLPIIIFNGAIWALALLYLVAAPKVYTSDSAINLPGAWPNTNVTLPDVGQASSESISPYAIGSQDPRENYKFIATSEPVIKAAADRLDMTTEEFGAPKIKLLGNTTFMRFQFQGATPEEARDKSIAFYEAFEERLNQLRVQEAAQRNADAQASLTTAQRKLDIAQGRLSEFKNRSGLNSKDQVSQLSSNIELLRKQQADVQSQQQQAYGRVVQLSSNLGLSPQQAADIAALQSDQLFQQNLKDYAAASANLTLLESRFQSTYPAVQDEQAKLEAARSAMMSRSQFLLGRPVSESTLSQLNIANSARDPLFQTLVNAQAEQKGMAAQAQEITRQITQLEARLKTLSQLEPTLIALQRDVQIAEAVFTSNLAKLDLNRKNLASYPVIQVVAEPSLPDEASSPKTKLILLGTAVGSLLFTGGLLALWLRKHQQVAKRTELKTAV